VKANKLIKIINKASWPIKKHSCLILEETFAPHPQINNNYVLSLLIKLDLVLPAPASI